MTLTAVQRWELNVCECGHTLANHRPTYGCERCPLMATGTLGCLSKCSRFRPKTTPTTEAAC